MLQTGAKFVATGEVIGQRPMSQRTDSMNIIARDSGLKDLLLRPLCAKHLPETKMEKDGIVARDKLLDFCGRGRQGQLVLAEEFGIGDIPGPGGGCKLTERENTRRYWTILKHYWETGGDIKALAANMNLANLGRMLVRQMDSAFHLLLIGRNAKDNSRLMAAADSNDLLLKLPFPGPVALARGGKNWPNARIGECADILVSFAPQEKRQGVITVLLQDNQEKSELSAQANRHETEWFLPDWASTHEDIKLKRKKQQELAKSRSAPDTRGS